VETLFREQAQDQLDQVEAVEFGRREHKKAEARRRAQESTNRRRRVRAPRALRRPPLKLWGRILDLYLDGKVRGFRLIRGAQVRNGKILRGRRRPKENVMEQQAAGASEGSVFMRVRDLLPKLEERHRRVVELRYFGGDTLMSYTAAGLAMGVNKESARRYGTDAMQHLARLMGFGVTAAELEAALAKPLKPAPQGQAARLYKPVTKPKPGGGVAKKPHHPAASAQSFAGLPAVESLPDEYLVACATEAARRRADFEARSKKLAAGLGALRHG